MIKELLALVLVFHVIFDLELIDFVLLGLNQAQL
jgi:hypothetical protein